MPLNVLALWLIPPDPVPYSQLPQKDHMSHVGFTLLSPRPKAVLSGKTVLGDEQMQTFQIMRYDAANML
jgi:hypothetical protein